MLIGKTERGKAKDINKAYVDLLPSDDISRVSGIERDRRVQHKYLRLCRNIATTVVSLHSLTIVNPMRWMATMLVFRQATYDYLEDLKKLMIVIDQHGGRTCVPR